MGSSQCIPVQGLDRGRDVSHCGNRAPKNKTWRFVRINNTQLSPIRYDNMAKRIVDSQQLKIYTRGWNSGCSHVCVFVPSDLDNVIKYAKTKGAWGNGDRTSLPIRLLVELKELTGSVWRENAVVHVQSGLERDECGVMLERDNNHCGSKSSLDNINMRGHPSVDLLLSTWWVCAGSFSP